MTEIDLKFNMVIFRSNHIMYSHLNVLYAIRDCPKRAFGPPGKTRYIIERLNVR
jgi:hypothetical protein